MSDECFGIKFVVLCEYLIPRPGFTPGGRGYSDFSYIHRLRLFWGFKILNFSISLGFRKMNTFLGMTIMWIFFGGHHKIRLY